PAPQNSLPWARNGAAPGAIPHQLQPQPQPQPQGETAWMPMPFNPFGPSFLPPKQTSFPSGGPAGMVWPPTPVTGGNNNNNGAAAPKMTFPAPPAAVAVAPIAADTKDGSGGEAPKPPLFARAP